VRTLLGGQRDHKRALLKPLIDLPRMAETAQEITKEALDSFFKEDTHLARQAIEKDVLVDQLQEQIIRSSCHTYWQTRGT